MVGLLDSNNIELQGNGRRFTGVDWEVEQRCLKMDFSPIIDVHNPVSAAVSQGLPQQSFELNNQRHSIFFSKAR